MWGTVCSCDWRELNAGRSVLSMDANHMDFVCMYYLHRVYRVQLKKYLPSKVNRPTWKRLFPIKLIGV